MNWMWQYFLKGQLLILSLQNPSLPHIWVMRSVEWCGPVWIHAKNYIDTQDLKNHISKINGLAEVSEQPPLLILHVFVQWLNFIGSKYFPVGNIFKFQISPYGDIMIESSESHCSCWSGLKTNICT